MREIVVKNGALNWSVKYIYFIIKTFVSSKVITGLCITISLLYLFVHRTDFSGHLAVINVPLQISILNPLTSRTRHYSLAAMEMEHCVTIFALTGGVQIERIDWFLVPTNLTNEAPTAADEAAGHVTCAHLYRGDQGGDQHA